MATTRVKIDRITMLELIITYVCATAILVVYGAQV